MKASELISELIKKIIEIGDLEVFCVLGTDRVEIDGVGETEDEIRGKFISI